MTFRTRLFLTSLAAAALALAVATWLTSRSIRASTETQIERSLVDAARLVAHTLGTRRQTEGLALDAEADALATLVSARVTLIDPGGTVVGDSALDAEGLRTVENHADRPEVQRATREGLGVARRHSATIDADLLYVAVLVRNPGIPQLDVVRLALPLTEVNQQLAVVWRSAFVAFGIALVAAAAVAAVTSYFLGRRIQAIAGVAQRYAAGDLSRPARDYGADEIGLVARVLDRTVQEIGRRAADLESDRARMQAILAGMIEGVLVVNEQGRLQLANGAARRMLRLADASEGRHYLEIVRQPDIAAQLGAALRGETTSALELTLPGTRDLIVTARSAPVVAHGSGGAVLVMHDITDLRRADRIRRDFVANVSHELRTPLTAVRGYVEALVDGGTDQADAKRFLEIIGRHTLRMERLVRDLLRLARLDAGQETLEHVPCVVEALFSGVETELAAAIESRQQTVEYRIAGDAKVVGADPAKLHDALRNLLENATNYAPESSTIVMGSARAGDRIFLTVEDRGRGIPEADLPRVFERFYRVDKARSRAERDPGGTGLGLSIVRHLIELHGGTVSAANRPEGGAIFTIDLPAST